MRTGTVQPGEGKAWGNLINVYKCLMRACKEDRIGLFSVISSEGTSGIGYRLKHRKFHLNIRKSFFYEGGQTLQQFAQRACGVSFLRNIQNPTGHGPEKPAAIDPVLRQGAGVSEL